MDAFHENMHSPGFTPSSTFGLEDQDGEETSPLCFFCLLPSSDIALPWHFSHPWWVSQVWQLSSPVCFPSTSVFVIAVSLAPSATACSLGGFVSEPLEFNPITSFLKNIPEGLFSSIFTDNILEPWGSCWPELLAEWQNLPFLTALTTKISF